MKNLTNYITLLIVLIVMASCSTDDEIQIFDGATDCNQDPSERGISVCGPEQIIPGKTYTYASKVANNQNFKKKFIDWKVLFGAMEIINVETTHTKDSTKSIATIKYSENYTLGQFKLSVYNNEIQVGYPSSDYVINTTYNMDNVNYEEINNSFITCGFEQESEDRILCGPKAVIPGETYVFAFKKANNNDKVEWEVLSGKIDILFKETKSTNEYTSSYAVIKFLDDFTGGQIKVDSDLVSDIGLGATDCYLEPNFGGIAVCGPNTVIPGKTYTYAFQNGTSSSEYAKWSVKSGEIEIINVESISQIGHSTSLATIKFKDNFTEGIIKVEVSNGAISDLIVAQD